MSLRLKDTELIYLDVNQAKYGQIKAANFITEQLNHAYKQQYKNVLCYERKSVVAERFTKTLKNKSYKYMTAISKNVYNGKLDDIIDKYNNTYHRTFKVNPLDVKTSTYFNFNVEYNDKDPKLKEINQVIISKQKPFLLKVTLHLGLSNLCDQESKKHCITNIYNERP